MMDKVLQRFGETNLKRKLHRSNINFWKTLSPWKCVSSDGVSPDPAKLAVVTNYPVPTNVDQLRSFLGFVDFYRQYKSIPQVRNAYKSV